ncbi:MAG: nucleoside triphosphate pyrophosphohydrolase [Candidatus Marinimicrobia bacterium]|nr:nucleoside triphosphate pyrophosphohydrolase [Candidatus Neomarinimicrobiota bacterium]|tara:strand:+ start:5514 stop:6287 length:774 start_codon:yes stop_codon:yes gene_type:complete
MTTSNNFEQLIAIVKKLRSENGCPWDKKQTHNSLLPYFLEEVYEVIDAIDNNDPMALSEELGDVLFHIIFQAEIATETDEFNLNEVLSLINKKLIRRHPHVFGEKNTKDLSQIKRNWEAIKEKEKIRESKLDGIGITLPSLLRAQRIQEKASHAGFDWDNKNEVWEKVFEEIRELKEAESQNNKDLVEEEMGDLFFTLVNLCRFLNISSEDSLRKSTNKFIMRFQYVEKIIKAKNKKLEDIDFHELNEIWEKGKDIL